MSAEKAPVAQKTPVPKPVTKSMSFKGMQKAAAFMLALPEEHVQKIFTELDEMEVVDLSQAMATLGKVRAENIESIFLEFVEKSGSSANLVGTLSSTQSLLGKVFSEGKVASIMEEISGPAGRTMWDKLNNVDEKSLANYLKNEHPQTIAVVLSKIKPDHAAKIFSLFSDDLSLEIMTRTIHMETVGRDILGNIEQTLKSEFIANFSRGDKKDPHERLAEVFNFFDRPTEGRFMEGLEKENKDSAERIRALMFTFNDIVKIDGPGIQTILRIVDKTKLGLALKGANEEIKALFFNNMSERAAKLLKEDMEALGMVRLRDVDEAQMEVVTATKTEIDAGKIVVSQGADDNDQLIG
tara:strand:- start:182 stop:1243 length:1062 start_codon:yes stop_codon:yes gene_type:complete